MVRLTMSDEIARLNAAVWTRKNSEYGDAWADEAWASQDIHWGLFELPESELHVLGDVAGLDAIELGCGTAYFSSWLASRGARVVGIDVTPAQLATARRCQEKFGLNFPLIEANAEHVPLPAGSFDLALSEYGACLWCEPELWVEEAARLLRPGGRLVFLTNSVVLALCIPERGVAGAALLRGQREIGQLAWPDDGVEFHLAHSAWIDLLARHGFTVERLADLYAPDQGTLESRYDFLTTDWAQRWPVEEIRVARRN